MYHKDLSPEYFNNLSKNCLPDILGIAVKHVEEGKLISEMPIQPKLFAPNGFVHAGSIITLADTLAGNSTIAHLPEGAISFTTMELKSNFLGAIREGTLECESTAEHMGRTSQIWRVIARNKETRKKIAIFSCTQLILYKQ